jgi:hypothetical protein
MRWVRARLIKAGLLALLLGGGIWFYLVALRPDPQRLEDWAARALEDIFGPHVRHGEMTVDLIDGVRIENLRVEDPTRSMPPLWAERVEVQHDVLALTTGILRLRRLTIEDPRISMRETESGEIELDFPFELPRGGGDAFRAPELVVRRGEIWFRAAPRSRWFREGLRLVLGDLDVDALNDAAGNLAVTGGFVPRDLGLERTGARIEIGGTSRPELDVLDLYATWDPLFLTPEVVGILSDDLRARVEAQRFEPGPHHLTVTVGRDPDVEEGRLRVVPRFRGLRRMDIADLPGTETIDATTREQINELFGRMELEVTLSGDRIDIRDLTSSLGSGRLSARGKIEGGGEVVDVEISITGLEIDDPALRRALGPLGDRIFEEFALEGGTIDASVRLERRRGEPFTWSADVFLQDVSLAYRGRPQPGKTKPDGSPVVDGFPYAMEHAYGHLFAAPGEILVDAIEGRHGAATIRVRGFRERSRSGGETGYVRWVEGQEADLRLTVEALDVPVDHDLLRAIDGSEFYDLTDEWRIGGTIDRVVVDVFQQSGRDSRAFVEVEVGVSGETLAFLPFPLELQDLEGTFRLLRPPVGAVRRGKEFHLDARATGAGGRFSILADLLASERRGRIHVDARGVRLDALGPAVEASPLVGEGLREAWDFLAPEGEADVLADLPAFEDPGKPRFEVGLRGGTFFLGAGRPGGCPCLTGVTGRVVATGDDTRIETLDGLLDGRPVAASGTIAGGPEGRWDLTVDAEDLRLTEPVLGTIHDLSGGRGLLPEGFGLRPGGRMDLTVRLSREPGAGEPFRAEVDAKDVDLTVNVGDLPVRVRGDLLVEGDEVKIRDLVAEGSGLSVEIPEARVTAEGLVGEARARLEDVEAGPELLSLLPEEVRDTIADLTRERVLEAKDLRVNAVEGGATTVRGRLALRARAGAAPGGAPRGEVEFDPLEVTAPDDRGERRVHGTVRFHGVSLEAGVPVQGLEGELVIPGIVLGDVPSGEAALRVRAARVAGLLVEGLDATLAWRDESLAVRPLRGTAYGGTIEGEVVARTGETPPAAGPAFRGRVRVTALSLERLFDDLGGSEYRGTADAFVSFESASGDPFDLRASGRVSAVCADLGELPVVANVPALVAGVVPGAEKPRFTHARAEFTVACEVVRAHRIVLEGPLFEMEGRGTLGFDGTIDLLFEPDFLQQLLVPGIKDVPVLAQIGDLLPEASLYVVRVRGHVSNPRTSVSALPYFTEGRGSRPFPAPPPADPPPRTLPRWAR